MTSTRATTDQQTRVALEAARVHRVVDVGAFVAAWVGLGYLFHLGSEAYLLVGIPLTIAFQVLVRRRPVRELLVRRSGPGVVPSTRPDLRAVAVAALLALAPLVWGLQAARSEDPWIVAWYAAAVVGAAAAAYALRSTSVRAVLRSAALPTAVGVVGNVLVVAVVDLATGVSLGVPGLLLGVPKWLAIYFPATFVMEEVVFRGALDAHIHHPGEARGLRSALYVSVLWGLWHLPVSHSMPFPLLLVSLVLWHCLVGVPLSYAWRRSGNLSGPALAHAAMDAVRNGLLGL